MKNDLEKYLVFRNINCIVCYLRQGLFSVAYTVSLHIHSTVT